jgi:diguanylate cyclase (GGDEF)-like protein
MDDNNNTKKAHQSSHKEYQFFLREEKIKLARILSILGVFLYGAFVIVDYFALPSAFFESTVVRLTVISIFLIGYSLTFCKDYIKYYPFIVSIEFFSAFLGVDAMIFIASPSDQAYSTYFTGVIIIMIALYSWTYLNVIVTSLLTIFALLGYMYIEFFIRNLSISESIPAVITNMFMFGSAVVFGLLAQVLRDSYLRRNFLLQKSLKEAYKEKVKESKNHKYFANHDPLTGLPNRRFAKEKLEKYIERVRQLDMALVIMYLDLNGFKEVNDIYGHKAGDEVLKIVAKRLISCVREGDCLTRLGADEFAVGLIVEKSELDMVDAIRLNIRKSIEKPIVFDGQKLLVSTSIGIASYPSNGDQLNVLMDIADKRMYQEKIENRKLTILAEEKNKQSHYEKSGSILVFPG